MNRTTYLCLLFSCFFSHLSAQIDPQKDLIRAFQIRDRIAPYFGNDRLGKPEIASQENDQEPASLEKGKQAAAKIFLDSKLFGHLRNAFKDSIRYEAALAFVLAHELTHHYKEHFKDESAESFRKHETEADQEGFFCARLAGFALDTSLVGQVITLIYQKYRVNTENYPSEKERKELCQQKIGIIQEKHLAEIFQVSAFFYSQGEYAHAARCLKYIYEEGEYQSEIISNNLGVMYLRAFLETLPTENPLRLFKLPIGFDNFHVRGILQRQNATDLPFDIPELLLGSAEDVLLQSLTKNKRYPKAYINLAILRLLQSSPSGALAELQKLDLYRIQADASVWVVKGIIHAWQGEEKDAKKAFEKGKQEGSQLAEFNLELYQRFLDQGIPLTKIQEHKSNAEKIRLDLEEEMKIKIPYVRDNNYEKELLAMKNQNLVLKTSVIKKIILADSPSAPFLHIHLLATASPEDRYWQIRVLYNQKRTDVWSKKTLIMINGGFTGTTAKNIRIGDNSARLLSVYGKPEPGESLDVLGDAFYKYNAAQMIFQTKDDKIFSMILFNEEL